jgi:GNAT superfamily N-acetyltransferase
MAYDAITLRPAIEADLRSLDRMLSTSYTMLLKADYPPSIQVTAVPIISRVNPGLVMSGTYYVAETQDGALVGAGGWTRSVKGPGIADVRHIVTDLHHLRRGVARRLMMGIFAEARAAGISRLECLATRSAVPFYRALGFEGETEVLVGLRPGIEFPAVRMRRSI